MAPLPRMNHPICLIETYVDDKLHVNEDAQMILAKISQPLVVVSIVGPCRTGKSYLMNKLSGHRGGGFSVGHTNRVNTRGIWMWCFPHPKKPGHTLVLLDTEGLGKMENGVKNNGCIILSLAMLMSSAVIYNGTGKINQDALENLNSILKMQNNILHKASVQEEKTQSKEKTGIPSSISPFFVWAIRDFTLKSEVKGCKPTTDEHFENCEEDVATRYHKAQRQNEILKIIRRYFPRQKCLFFGLPSSDKQALSTLDQVPEKDLETNFVSETADFCKFIYEEAPAKRLREEQIMTGSAFAQLLKSYVDVATKGDIAHLERSMSDMSMEKNRRAMSKSVASYETKMEVQQVNTEEEFQRLHEKSLEEALHEFEKKYVEHDMSQTEYLNQLKKDLRRKREEVWKIHENLSWEKCEGLIQRLMCDVDQALRENKYHIPGGYKRFLNDKNNIIKRYNQEPNKGVKAQEVLKDFLDSLEEIEHIILKTDQAISAKKQKQPEDVYPKDYSQLTKYIQSYQLPTGRFDRILIQLFGFTGHGKSSFVNSCLYILGNGRFQDQAGEGVSHGGKTMERKAYELSDAITIVDNRGFAKLDAPEAWEIYAQLCNFAPLNKKVNWDKSIKMRNDLLTQKSKEKKIPHLIVPVLVYSSEHILSKEDFTLIKDFLKQAQKLTGVLPFIILTKCRTESELRNEFTRMGMENIYCIENYTVSDHLAVKEKHLVLLNVLRDILLCVNFHLQECVNFQTQQHEWTSFLKKMAHESPTNQT
ncbi:guanylate-binding protein 1-like [Lithobates pipiens]